MNSDHQDVTRSSSGRGAILILCALAVSAVAPLREEYSLNWYTADSGGILNSTGGDYQLCGTIGQPDAGSMTGGEFELLGGFWGIVPALAAPCPQDLNGDRAVNAADLALLLGNWGANPGHPADFNEDGMINAADLAMLLGHWGPCG